MIAQFNSTPFAIYGHVSCVIQQWTAQQILATANQITPITSHVELNQSENTQHVAAMWLAIYKLLIFRTSRMWETTVSVICDLGLYLTF